MATWNNQADTSEPGIIILGNAGAGKSYLCNLLIGHDQFEADFRPESVTKKTEFHRILVESSYVRIYNIPGLVEANQSEIEQNKREIMRAFQECPVSIVIFVWTQVGGRAQQDDIIAFKALNDAYQFPPESLMFVVNNIPSRRPAQYEGQFIATLTNMLKPISIWMNDVFFVDHMEPEEIEKQKEVTSKLFLLIRQHHASLQKKHKDIILQSDQLEEMRKTLNKQRLEAEKDREAFQNQIQRMAAEYNESKEKANRQFQQMEGKLKKAELEAEKERQRSEAERAAIQTEFEAAKREATLSHQKLMKEMELEKQKAEKQRQYDKEERAVMQTKFDATKKDAEVRHERLMNEMEKERERSEAERQRYVRERAEREAEYKAAQQAAEVRHQNTMREMEMARQKFEEDRLLSQKERIRMQEEYETRRRDQDRQHQERMRDMEQKKRNDDEIHHQNAPKTKGVFSSVLGTTVHGLTGIVDTTADAVTGTADAILSAVNPLNWFQ